MAKSDWQQRATNLLKAELMRAGVDYEELSRRLAAIGVDESYRGLISKINRGTFSFSFFLQCMEAIGTDSVRVGR